MSTINCRSAHRSTSTEPRRRPRAGPAALCLWTAVLCLWTAARALAAPSANAEAEHALARQSQLYVVVDPAHNAAELKIRGKAFLTLPLADWGLFVHHQVPGPDVPEKTLPATFQITGEPTAAVRRIETVQALRPFAKDEDPPVPAAATAPAPAPAAAPARPAAFDVPLADGWVLRVGPKLPATCCLGPWATRLADGWARLRGRAPARPALLALALDATAAGRLHHVLRPGTMILVLADAGETHGSQE